MGPATAHTTSPANGVGGSSWKSFLDAGSQGVSEAVVLEGGYRVKLSWVDGHESEFSLTWLRDHSDGSFHVNTKQRKIDTSSIANDARIEQASLEMMSSSPSPDADPNTGTNERSKQVLRLRWDADGNSSGEQEECTVPVERLRLHCLSETARTLRPALGTPADVQRPNRTLWGKGILTSTTGGSLPSFEYKEIMEEDQQSLPASSSSSSSSKTALSQLRDVVNSHGIALVRGVPIDAAGTETLGLKFCGHLMSSIRGKTLWGISIEDIDPDTLFPDLAYTEDGLPLHTDYVFSSYPPSLQLGSCQQKALEGGATNYVDGFAVAERLRTEHPEAFDFFTKTSITYQYIADGYHMVADGPIIRTDSLGEVVQMRYNDTYRAPLDYLSNDDVDRFYRHHKSLSAILRDPSMVESIVLEPGETVIFNNHRALHARKSYKGARRMIGCYIGKDEAHSEARLNGTYV